MDYREQSLSQYSENLQPDLTLPRVIIFIQHEYELEYAHYINFTGIKTIK